MSISKTIVQVLATSYIFVTFSRHLFWARFRPEDSLSAWLATWLAYSLAAYVFLAVISHFKVKNRWALFLAGTAVGWLALPQQRRLDDFCLIRALLALKASKARCITV